VEMICPFHPHCIPFHLIGVALQALGREQEQEYTFPLKSSLSFIVKIVWHSILVPTLFHQISHSPTTEWRFIPRQQEQSTLSSPKFIVSWLQSANKDAPLLTSLLQTSQRETVFQTSFYKFPSLAYNYSSSDPSSPGSNVARCGLEKKIISKLFTSQNKVGLVASQEILKSLL